ncbi:MAG: HigA family addiction module antidote protein [Treponema sp.]|jgi:addiction module HigA family antidote|nr:HigA family addiction module antidote protein [Treponema sp.]
MAKPVSQHPGVVFNAFLEEYNLTPSKAARDIKLSQPSVRMLTLQQLRVSAPVALRLAKYFGTTVEFWINLQNGYDLAKANNDKALSAVLKGIKKAQKPDPVKKPAKAAAKTAKSKTAKSKTGKSAGAASKKKPRQK